MPDDDPNPDNPEIEAVRVSVTGSGASGQLPSMRPQRTAAKVRYNLLNMRQVLSRAFHRLAPDHGGKRRELFLRQFDSIDKRPSKFAMDHAQKEHDAGRRILYIGGFLALFGMLAANHLDSGEVGMIGQIIVTCLAAFVAVIAGNKLLG